MPRPLTLAQNAEPLETDRAIVFLSSHEASFLTETGSTADGGPNAETMTPTGEES